MSEQITVPEEQKVQLNDEEHDFFDDSDSSFEQITDEYILGKQKADIVDVWGFNFEEELEKISKLVQKYNVIAMDTEFPGINNIPKNNGNIDEKNFEYQLIKENVKHQKIIQIGISLADENGNVPDCVSTWQFNFKFDENNDQISQDSKNLLKNAGINFPKFKEDGLDFAYFSEMMIISGIILNEDVTWVAFHGGFDFGYYLQMVYGKDLPDSSEDFYKILSYFFPQIYDIKYLIKDSPTLKDMGLQKLSSELEVKRIGPQHQAGSDSLLTLATYFKLKDKYYANKFSIFDNGQNIIYGIGQGYLGTKDRDYLQAYKILSNNSEMQNNYIQSDMNLQYTNYNNMYYDVMAYNQNQHMNPDYTSTQGQIHQPHFMHPQWQMNMNYFQPHLIQDDQLNQQKINRNKKHQQQFQ